MTLEDKQTMYLGQQSDQWQSAVDNLNNVHKDILPKCLIQGRQQEWIGVNESFPKVNLNETQINNLEKANEQMKFITNAVENNVIAADESGTREEMSAMDIYHTCKDFFHIMELRMVCYTQYKKVLETCKGIILNQNDILYSQAQHSVGNAEEKKKISQYLLSQYAKWDKARSTYIKEFINFEVVCKNLQALETKVNTSYLNPQVFKENELKDIEENLITLDGLWADAHKYLRDNNQTPVVKNVDNKEEKAKEKKIEKDIQDKKNRKFTYLTELNDEAKKMLDKASLRELDVILKDINNVYDDLKFENNSVKDKETLTSVRETIKTLNVQIEKLTEANDIKKQKQRTEINANLKAMDIIPLPDLKGYENFITWRKAQYKLNSHTDTYKRAQALLNTLKVPDDIQRCKGIMEFKRLMELLEGKYLHMENLIPSLLTKLKSLNKATDSRSFYKNINIILNVYENLKEIDRASLSKFDATIIDSLLLLFPHHEQQYYDRRRNEKINDFRLIDELGEGAEIDQSDSMIRNRQFFINHITELEKANNTTMARYNYTSDHKKKPHHEKPRQHKQTSYSIDVKESTCLPCGSKSGHKNTYGRMTKSIGQCPEFKKWNLEKRKSFIKSNNYCLVCLNIGHNKANCRIEAKCKFCNNGQKHHPLICDKNPKNHVTVGVHCISCQQKDGEIMLRYSEAILVNHRESAKVCHEKIIVFYDCGSTANFVRMDTARKFNYTPVGFEFVTLMTYGRQERRKMPIYELILIDKCGKEHKIRAYGDRNMKKEYNRQHSRETIEHYSKIFSVRAKDINNPVPNETFTVDLILGECDIAFAPKIKTTAGNTALSSSLLGKHYILSGNVKRQEDYSLNVPPDHLRYINNYENLLHHDPDIHLQLPESDRKEYVFNVETQIRNQTYWTSDQLGCNTEPRCITCLKASACKECSYLTHPQSIKEQQEAKIIRNSMKYDDKENNIKVSYPYLKDPKLIFPPEKTNKPTAEKMAITLKRGLERDKLMNEYTEAFMAMEERNAIKELTEEEMLRWESKGGAVNYASHHAVLKDSKSTACRSVCNSSLAHAGTSLNALLPKGPKAISNLLHVLMRFRSTPYTIVADLSKAYNTIRTSEQDMHLRRLLWYRVSDLKDENPKLRTFGMTSVAFGDTPSAYYLELSKMMVSEKLKTDGHTNLSSEIIRSSYVDDFCIPIEHQSQIDDYKMNMKTAFQSFGFKIKEFLVPGEGGDRPMELLFGHLYDLFNDTIQLKFVVNFSTKKRSQKTGENLTSKSDLKSLKMTKRKFMSLLASQYDPLGLASVYLSKYKIFLAKLFKNPKYDGWDTELEGEEHRQSIAMVKEIIHANENKIVFKRSTKPEGFKLVRLVVFTDASMNCLQVVLYGIFQNENGDIHTALLSGKNKICTNTIPRNELQALVAGHRLVMNFVKAMNSEYIANVKDIVFLTDSSCVCDSLAYTYQSKDVYVLNRVSEIYSTVRKLNVNCKYFHISTKINIADSGTRENCKYEFLNSKEWKEGPEFIKDIEKEKLATFKYEINPKLEKNCDIDMYNIETQKEEFNEVITKLLSKFRSFNKICRIYSIIKSWKRFCNKDIPVEEKKYLINFNETKLELLRLCTPSDKNIEGVKRKYYVECDDNNNVNLISRPYTVGDGAIADKMILLDYNDISKSLLYDMHIHTSNIEREYCKMLEMGYFVIGARNYFKRLQQSCLTCKRIRQEAVKAKIGPSMNIEAAKQQPFTHCFSDIKGPIWTKISRNVKKKIYILTLTDIFSRYTVFTLLLDMTANSVLQALKTVAYSVGGATPVYLYTDFGTNYVPIRNITENNYEPSENLKVSDLSLTLSANNIKLILSSAKAPWRQGAVEAMHKIFIRTLKRSNLTSKSYNIAQWIHILWYITYHVNCRPLSLKINDNLTVLTPNKLVFGKSRSEIYTPEKLTDNIENNKLYDHLSNLTKELNQFRSLYVNTYIQECKKTNKWKTNSVILKPNDVVLILDHCNKTSGYPTIGIVKEVLSDRTFKISYVKKEAQINDIYQITKQAVLSELIRPAQGLSFICEGNKQEINIEPQPTLEQIAIPHKPNQLKIKTGQTKKTSIIKDIN